MLLAPAASSTAGRLAFRRRGGSLPPQLPAACIGTWPGPQLQPRAGGWMAGLAAAVVRQPARATMSTHPRPPARPAQPPTLDCHAAAGGDGGAGLRSLDVVVIGAGAAGLAAARELRGEGHRVVVYEQSKDVGGVWVYDPQTEGDALGVDEGRQRVHSSMYRDLRVNLPSELMSYQSFPFLTDEHGDPQRFCGHETVRRYLRSYAEANDLLPLIKFATRVLEVAPSRGEGGAVGPLWDVTVAPEAGEAGEGAAGAAGAGAETAQFDAVVICNGHFSEPRLPAVAGSSSFPGRELHSHNYRVREEFEGQRVVVVGAGNSGEDICRDISRVAEAVWLSAREFGSLGEVDVGESAPLWGPGGNIVRRPMLKALSPDGGAAFEGGLTAEEVDAVVYCTGYEYNFPFLNLGDEALLDVQDNCVGPLYEQVFPAAVGPTLSIIGMPFRVAPFPLMEIQSLWVARVLSGRARLPGREEMLAEAAERDAERRAEGVERRHAHMLSSLQWDYLDRLLDWAGAPERKLQPWRREMYEAASRVRSTMRTSPFQRGNPDSYRDTWDDEHLREAAREEFAAIRGAERTTARASCE